MIDKMVNWKVSLAPFYIIQMNGDYIDYQQTERLIFFKFHEFKFFFRVYQFLENWDTL